MRYAVQKLDKSLPIVENFRCLVNELKSKGKGTTRSIIYCQTVKHCAHLFCMLELQLYNGINAKAADAEMKKYLEFTCCRQFLLNYFGVRNLECPPGHLCCDICTNSCQCLGGYCDMDLYLPIDNTEEAQGRTISQEQLSSLKTELDALKKTIVTEGIAATGQQNALKLACHTKPFEFGTHQV